MQKKFTETKKISLVGMSHSEKLNYAIKLQDENKNSEAIQVLKKILKNNSNDFIVYAMLGHIYYKLEKYVEAIPNFNKVLELNPASEAASSRLFHSLNILGQGDDAMNEMIRFLKLNDKLKKDYYVWILNDLLNDIDNPQLQKHKNQILLFKQKFNIGNE